MVRCHDLYYFLYPPALVAARVAQLQCSRLLEVPMPTNRMHLTLQPLGRFKGGVPDDILALALHAGADVDSEPFDVVLDLLQSHGNDAAAGTLELAARGPAARKMRIFQRCLGETLGRHGFPHSLIRTHFRPHMTLDYAHRRTMRQVVAPVAWTATQFFLVDSHFGQGRHEVLAQWPLRARQHAFAFEDEPTCPDEWPPRGGAP